MPIDEAVEYMKQAIVKTYSKKGEKIVNMNCAAVDAGLTALKKIDVPAGWADLKDEEETVDQSLPTYIREIQIPVNKQAGDKIPVSKFMPYADGVSPVETSKYERRGIATNVPKWIPENCIGCNMCSLVCPHAAIRPFLVTEEEKAAAPTELVTKKCADIDGYEHLATFSILKFQCLGAIGIHYGHYGRICAADIGCDNGKCGFAILEINTRGSLFLRLRCCGIRLSCISFRGSCRSCGSSLSTG